MRGIVAPAFMHNFISLLTKDLFVLSEYNKPKLRKREAIAR